MCILCGIRQTNIEEFNEKRKNVENFSAFSGAGAALFVQVKEVNFVWFADFLLKGLKFLDI